MNVGNRATTALYSHFLDLSGVVAIAGFIANRVGENSECAAHRAELHATEASVLLEATVELHLRASGHAPSGIGVSLLSVSIGAALSVSPHSGRFIRAHGAPDRLRAGRASPMLSTRGLDHTDQLSMM
jgi:hypothetical protein